MAKKRKAGTKGAGATGPREVNPKDAKLNVKSWEDVADSEDEFHIHRDKILLDEEPSRKRQRLQAEKDAFFEPSDEEVLAAPGDSDLEAYDEVADDDDDDEEDEDDGVSDDDDEIQGDKKAASKARARQGSASDGEEEEDEREEGWGTSKRDYYNADMIETEADALEEEQEALRLQKKQLQGMQDADYGFDENEWLDADKDGDHDEDREGTVQEILPELDITEEMTPQERSKILSARYPEFGPLAKEFLELQPLHEDLVLADAAAKAVLKHSGSQGEPYVVPVASIKRSALGGYLAALSMYFAVLSSGSKTTNGDAAAKPPAELRDHPIMETLMSCRSLWDKVKDIPLPDPADLISSEEDPIAAEENGDESEDEIQTTEKPKKKKKTKAEKAASKARAEAEARRTENAQRLEERLAKIDDRSSAKASKLAVPVQPAKTDDDDTSDFGEETTLTAEEAAEKARRKKGLRFYTSQIAQKANKREAAGRFAGGDDDIPRRERLKDRVARLNTEAEARGRKKNGGVAADKLGGDSDEEDARVAKELRTDGDEEYYQTIAGKTQAKKDAKAARAAAEQEARAQGGRVVETEEVGPDGKRNITWAIEKNKGLTPHRNKDNRNPRVKKRKKYEEKKKKLKSVRAVYSGGEGRGGYKGELTGIKTGLIKSRKL